MGHDHFDAAQSRNQQAQFDPLSCQTVGSRSTAELYPTVYKSSASLRNPNAPSDLHPPLSLPSPPPQIRRSSSARGSTSGHAPFSSGEPHHFVARRRRRRRVGVGSLPFPIPGCSTLLETGSFLLLAPFAPFLSPSPPQICSGHERCSSSARAGRMAVEMEVEPQRHCSSRSHPVGL